MLEFCHWSPCGFKWGQAFLKKVLFGFQSAHQLPAVVEKKQWLTISLWPGRWGFLCEILTGMRWWQGLCPCSGSVCWWGIESSRCLMQTRLLLIPPRFWVGLTWWDIALDGLWGFVSWHRKEPRQSQAALGDPSPWGCRLSSPVLWLRASCCFTNVKEHLTLLLFLAPVRLKKLALLLHPPAALLWSYKTREM